MAELGKDLSPWRSTAEASAASAGILASSSAPIWLGVDLPSRLTKILPVMMSGVPAIAIGS
jgi:hypothetical protein